MIEIVIPQTPVGKGRARFVKATGRAFTPQKTVAFEGLVALAGQEAMDGRPPLTGPLHIAVTAYFPIPASKPKKWQAAASAGRERPTKKPDWDNLGKSVSDALNQIVYIDDAQIVDATVRKFYAAVPRTIVQVTEINAGGIFG